MAITAELVTALGGGKIDYVPLTPNAQDFKVELPAGMWLVQIEVSNTSSSSYIVKLGGVETHIPGDYTCLMTRIVQGGTLTGNAGGSLSRNTFTHGIAIRLGD